MEIGRKLIHIISLFGNLRRPLRTTLTKAVTRTLTSTLCGQVFHNCTSFKKFVQEQLLSPQTEWSLHVPYMTNHDRMVSSRPLYDKPRQLIVEYYLHWTSTFDIFFQQVQTQITTAYCRIIPTLDPVLDPMGGGLRRKISGASTDWTTTFDIFFRQFRHKSRPII